MPWLELLHKWLLRLAALRRFGRSAAVPWTPAGRLLVLQHSSGAASAAAHFTGRPSLWRLRKPRPNVIARFRRWQYAGCRHSTVLHIYLSSALRGALAVPLNWCTVSRECSSRPDCPATKRSRSSPALIVAALPRRPSHSVSLPCTTRAAFTSLLREEPAHSSRNRQILRRGFRVFRVFGSGSGAVRNCWPGTFPGIGPGSWPGDVDDAASRWSGLGAH